MERLSQQFVFSEGSSSEVDKLRQEWIDSIPQDKQSLERQMSEGAGTFIPRAPLDVPAGTVAGPLSASKIVLLKPSKPLASKLPVLDLTTGTLNFTQGYVAQLIELGYNDTRAFFSE